MPKLTKEEILSGRALKRETVIIEELGGEIELRKLSAAQVRDLQKKIVDAQKEGDQAIYKVVLHTFIASAVNEDGTLMFSEADIEGLAGALPLSVLADLSKQVMELSKLGDEAKKHQEEVEKNS